MVARAAGAARGAGEVTGVSAPTVVFFREDGSIEVNTDVTVIDRSGLIGLLRDAQDVERARVVAWLREVAAGAAESRAFWRDVLPGLPDSKIAETTAAFADAIERGEHEVKP